MGIISAIGNTPLVPLNNINESSQVTIYGKLEGLNPGGSIKDRPAYYMIKKAEEDGYLTKNKTILEPTSGNTGIGLAMISAALGYKIKLCMPGCVSMERKHILQAFGAEVDVTPPKQGTDGAIRRAHQLLKEFPEIYYMPNQFANPNNALAHYETTGPEIFKQLDGKIDAFVAGMGTTGTLMGVSRFFKEKNENIKIVAVEPTLGHTIQGLKNLNEAIVPDIFDKSRIDEKITVYDDEAFEMARRLATEEGIFVGISSGAAVCGALKYAKKLKKGHIAVILPDRGDRYLSTTLFKAVCAKCPP